MKRCLALVDALSHGAAISAAVMMVVLALLTLAEIVASSLLGSDLEFAFEYGTYLLILIVFAGAAHAMRSGEHIRISLLLGRLGPRARRLLETLCTGLALAIILFIAAAVTDMAVGSLVEGSRTYLASGTPLAYPQGLLALTLWLFALELAARLARCLTGAAPDAERPIDDPDGSGA